MTWRTSTRHAEIACDFPGCLRVIAEPLGPNYDVHCDAHVHATDRAIAEGWQADPKSPETDLCPRHVAVLDALVDALVQESLALGGRPDRARVRALIQRNLTKAEAPTTEAP